ncbi:hypothetical protein Tco_0622800 [Tanacetum coccineum]
MHVGTHEMWLNNRFECYVVFKGYSGAARHATTFSTTSIFYDNSDVRNIGPSTSRAGRNARGNPDVSLTTGEATYSRGIRGRPSVNVRQTTTVCSSNFIHDNDVRNTSRGGRNTRANPEVGLATTQATCSSGVTRRRPSTCGPTIGSSTAQGPHTLTLILETLISVVVILELPSGMVNA